MCNKHRQYSDFVIVGPTASICRLCIDGIKEPIIMGDCKACAVCDVTLPFGVEAAIECTGGTAQCSVVCTECVRKADTPYFDVQCAHCDEGTAMFAVCPVVGCAEGTCYNEHEGHEDVCDCLAFVHTSKGVHGGFREEDGACCSCHHDRRHPGDTRPTVPGFEHLLPEGTRPCPCCVVEADDLEGSCCYRGGCRAHHLEG